MSDPNGHQSRCGSCNGPLEAGARFCGACGRPLSPAVLEHAQARPGPRGKRRNSWRWAWGLVGAMVVLAGATAAARLAVWGVGDSAGDAPEIVETDWAAFDLPDPGQVDLRSLEPDEARDTGVFLRGEGGRLIEFHDSTSMLLTLAIDDPVEASGECLRFVDEVLIPLVGRHPAELFALASSVPEGEIALRMMDDVAAKRDFLAVCGTRQDSERLRELQAETRFSHTMVARYLARLEVAQ